jgi:hypothetical protein
MKMIMMLVQHQKSLQINWIHLNLQNALLIVLWTKMKLRTVSFVLICLVRSSHHTMQVQAKQNAPRKPKKCFHIKLVRVETGQILQTLTMSTSEIAIGVAAMFPCTHKIWNIM